MIAIFLEGSVGEVCSVEGSGVEEKHGTGL